MRSRTLRSISAAAAGAAALLVLADVLRWMLVGPIPLVLLGGLIPAGNDLEAEAGLVTLLAVTAFVSGGGLRLRAGPQAVAAGLTLTVLLANVSPVPSGDTAPATLLPFALVRDGRLTFEGTGLGSPLLPLGADPLPYYLVRSSERIASKYSPAVGVLATPVYLPAALGRFDAREPDVQHLGKLAAAVLTALGAGCVHAAAARLVGEPFATAGTALYVLGTPVLSVLGQSLWLHTGVALGISVALLGLTEGASSSARRVGALVGLGVGLALSCRQVDVVLAAGFAGALWQARPRALAWMLGAASLPVLLLAWYHWRVFGSPLATGYGAEAHWGWSAPLIEGVPGLLLSPGRGLLTQSPVLVLAVAALIGAGHGASPRWFLPLGIALGLFVCLMGHWYMWWGGYSSGNRMLADALPILGVALACGLRAAWERRGLRAPVVALSALSVATFLTLAFTVERDPLHGGDPRPRPWAPGSHPLVSVANQLLSSPADPDKR